MWGGGVLCMYRTLCGVDLVTRIEGLELWVGGQGVMVVDVWFPWVWAALCEAAGYSAAD